MRQGTREQFQTWLAGRGLTLTKYNQLTPEAKRAIYQQYQKRGTKDETLDSRGK